MNNEYKQRITGIEVTENYIYVTQGNEVMTISRQYLEWAIKHEDTIVMDNILKMTIEEMRLQRIPIKVHDGDMEIVLQNISIDNFDRYK